MIIFDEKAYAEDIIQNGYKNKKYISFDNIILVKYWKSLGLNEKDIRCNLKNIMSEFQDLFNDGILDYKLDKALKVGMKYDLLTNVSIQITQTELDQIKLLETLELQKMMFVLLVVWKFKGKPQRFRITNTDLMNLSKVKVNNNMFWDYIHSITKSKMLSMVEYKNKSYYRINVSDNGDVTLLIDRFDNVIDYYLRLVLPDKYKNCEHCQRPIQITNGNKKYCKDCARDVEKSNWAKRKQKQRTKTCHEAEGSENP